VVYFLIRWVSFVFFKLYLGFRVTGRKHVPAKGPFIIAANHSSYLDPLLITAAVHRTLSFMARENIFRCPVIGWIVKHAYAIPVKRHGRDMSAVKNALRVLKNGGALAIFPEGTRTKNKKLKPAKAGVGFIVYKAKVPVVPVYIEGSFDAMPRSIKTLKRYPVRVYIGKPVHFRKVYVRTQGKGVYQEIGNEIMQRIEVLKK